MRKDDYLYGGEDPAVKLTRSQVKEIFATTFGFLLCLGALVGAMGAKNLIGNNSISILGGVLFGMATVTGVTGAGYGIISEVESRRKSKEALDRILENQKQKD